MQQENSIAQSLPACYSVTPTSEAEQGPGRNIPLHSLPGALQLFHAIFGDVSMSSENIESPSNIILYHLLLGIGVSDSIFMVDVVVSFLKRKFNMFPF